MTTRCYFSYSCFKAKVKCQEIAVVDLLLFDDEGEKRRAGSSHSCYSTASSFFVERRDPLRPTILAGKFERKKLPFLKKNE